MSVNLRGTRRKVCETCRGNGKILKNSVFDWGWKTCPDCNGKGYIEYKLPPTQPAPQRRFRRF